VRRRLFTPRDRGLGYGLAGAWTMFRYPGIGLAFFGLQWLLKIATIPVVAGFTALCWIAFGGWVMWLGFPWWGTLFSGLGLLCWLRAG
jgi:hypothetical protein